MKLILIGFILAAFSIIYGVKSAIRRLERHTLIETAGHNLKA